MGLNINLFVHGVPMGQKVWGPKGDDYLYWASFYGPRWETPEVMKVDVKTFRGTSYCYYSLVKGLNVCDSAGRAGSYFALTLRINAFYIDVQNLYSILKATYDKMCVGLCVQESGNATKYLIADFQSIDAQLKAIENHIVNYISNFSINEDLVSLQGFPANSGSASREVNLHDCGRPLALEYGRKYGTFMVSPYFQSFAIIKKIAECESEVETTKQQAQQQLQAQQKACQAQLDALRQGHQARLEEVKQQAQQQLQAQQKASQAQLDALRQEYEGEIAEIQKRAQRSCRRGRAFFMKILKRSGRSANAGCQAGRESAGKLQECPQGQSATQRMEDSRMQKSKKAKSKKKKNKK